MKLYYYQDDMANFGDDLNAWLWPRVIPELLDDDASHLLLGIGTIINHKLPQADRYTVIGSGVGYGKLPVIDQHWQVVSVRGKLSCRQLGLDESLGIIDPAYLLPGYLEGAREKLYPVSLIPHARSLEHGHWQEVADALGIHLIDPRTDDIENFVRQITASERVITEAMHGAIVADCYSIPWRGYRAYDYINGEKWNDWLSVFDHNVTLTPLPSLFRGDADHSFIERLKSRSKHLLMALGLDLSERMPAIPRRTTDKQFEAICAGLNQLIGQNGFYCTDPAIISQRVTTLMERIAGLQSTNG